MLYNNQVSNISYSTLFGHTIVSIQDSIKKIELDNFSKSDFEYDEEMGTAKHDTLFINLLTRPKSTTSLVSLYKSIKSDHKLSLQDIKKVRNDGVMFESKT